MSRVLFLCTGNYYRSRFAEEYFNDRARHRALTWRAASRGLAQDMATTGNVGPMSEDALDVLRLLGINPAEAHRYPIAATAADFEVHERLVALSRREHQSMIETLFPDYVHRIEYFDIEDGHLEPAASALNRLVQYVEAMLDDLR